MIHLISVHPHPDTANRTEMRGTVKISANLKPRFVNPQIKLQNGNVVETKSDAGTFYTQYEEKALSLFFIYLFFT